MDDGELMREVRAGDRAAFEELYRRHAQRVFAYLWRFTGDETAAADLRQDTFFRFWLARSFPYSLPAGAVATFRWNPEE